MYTADLVCRLSLMCIEPTVEPKLKQPYSDPSHLSSRCRQAVHRLVNKSQLLTNRKDKKVGGKTCDDTCKITRNELRNEITNESSMATYHVKHGKGSEMSDKDDLGEIKASNYPSRSTTLEGSESLLRHPSKLRLSFPIPHSVEPQLPPSYNLARFPKSRPLTPILKTHCTRLPKKPVAIKPVQVDFLMQLPVDVALLLLKYYISPCDLPNVRLVSRYYHMLCQLKQVKCRWKVFKNEKSLAAKKRGQENPIARNSWVSSMSQSHGVLSPIQTAAALPGPWQVYNSPQSTIATSQKGGNSTSMRVSTLRSGTVRGLSPHTPARGLSPHTPARTTKTSSRIHNSPHTPLSVSRKPPPAQHPSKRAPSSYDIKYDNQATPDKDKKSGSDKHREHGFLTPSKRYADGINKVSRTPLKTLNFGTPSSTCSSRTSFSSTASLRTPDVHTTHLRTPTSTEGGFRVPHLPSRSRQRLKRL